MASVNAHSSNFIDKNNTSSSPSSTISLPSSSPITMQRTTHYNAQDVSVEATNRQSILDRLTYDDQQALMHFALGTAKYYKLPSVQGMGIKLLSALLAAAP